MLTRSIVPRQRPLRERRKHQALQRDRDHYYAEGARQGILLARWLGLQMKPKDKDSCDALRQDTVEALDLKDPANGAW